MYALYVLYVLIALPIATIIGFIKFITCKTLNMTTSMGRVINRDQTQITIAFPYFEDKYLLIIKFYIHVIKIKVPTEVEHLIWKFHGYHTRKRKHYIISYRYPSLSDVKSPYMVMLHSKDMNNFRNRFAIPIMIFDDNFQKNIFILMMNIHESMAMFMTFQTHSLLHNSTKHFNIFTFILSKYRYHGVLLQRRSVTERYDSTYKVIYDASNTKNDMKPCETYKEGTYWY